MKYFLSLLTLSLLVQTTFAFTPSEELLYVLEEKTTILEQRILEQGGPMRNKMLRAIEQLQSQAKANEYRNIDKEKFDFVLGFLAMKIEKAGKKQVTRNDFKDSYEGFDIVTYPETIVATVINAGPLGQTNDDSFENLADFIFGNNSANTEIAMTSPVTRTQLNDSIYETAFIMPSGRTLDSLPNPNNDRITLKTIPGSLKAVRKFSGRVTKEKVNSERALFQKDLTEQGVLRYGLPTLSQYDGPRVSASKRRNELWVELNELD